jgi:hypothetical protein
LPVDADAAVRLHPDADAVAERGARVDRPLDEELVETPALRHQAENLVGVTIHRPPVLQTAADPRDPVLDDGLDGVRELAHRTHRQAAAAGLVARETGLVY